MNDAVIDPIWTQSIEVQHLGHVGAGSAINFFDHPRSQLILRPQWVRDFKQVGTVTVSGDSGKHDGILDGDVLIVKLQFERSEIKDGRLVIAYLPTGGSVMKRIYFEGNQIILRSSNPEYQDMIFGPDEIRVDGIVMELKRELY